MKFPASELWNYSTQTYRIPEIETACLNLQNRHHADVNILLYCCWCGDKGFALSVDDMNRLIATTTPWQEYILRPLRNARRMMKQQVIAMPADIHEQSLRNMSEMEIHAEHMAQLALEKAIDLDRRPPGENMCAVEISAANLLTYMERLGQASTDSTRAELGSLLNAIYQNEEAVQSALTAASC